MKNTIDYLMEASVSLTQALVVAKIKEDNQVNDNTSIHDYNWLSKRISSLQEDINSLIMREAQHNNILPGG